MDNDSTQLNELIHTQIWGKASPYKPLVDHMIDVGVTAQVLIVSGCMAPVGRQLSKLLNTNELQIANLIGYIAAMHDIGKCHPLFQQKSKDLEIVQLLASLNMLQVYTGHEFRHEKYSEIVFKRLLKASGYKSNTTATAVTSLKLHHQGKSGNGSEPLGEKLRTFWQAQQDKINQIILDVFIPDLGLLSRCNNEDCFGVLISGIIILADWLASGQPEFTTLCEQDNFYDYYQSAAKSARQSIFNCGLSGQRQLPKAYDFSIFWPKISEQSIRPVQRACVETCREITDTPCGLYIVEAAMGEGKTEAALYIAAHLMNTFDKEGMYVALPTSATSNQMHSRVQDLLETHQIGNVRLLHSMAWQIDDNTDDGHADVEDAEDVVKWLAPLRKGMLSSYAVGTVDQAMLSVMTVKYGFLRLLGLANKVLILDEVHAYDSYMSTIIERLLEWCSVLNVPVILLSATLPYKKRAAFIKAYSGCGNDLSLGKSYPLITSVRQDGQFYEHAVGDSYIKRQIEINRQPLLDKWEETAVLALQKVSEGGCLCIIVNTVKEAQDLYLALKKLNNYGQDIWLKLFHARFTADDRRIIEDECILAFGKESAGNSSKRPKRAILVATQVVEQSLDIDFDEMISAIAPIDLLLQRMGRLHRHDGRQRPQSMNIPRLTILTPSDKGDYGNTKYVYAPWILNKTLETISNIDEIHIPADLRPLVEAVYDAETPDTGSYEFKQWYEMIYKEQFNAGMAGICIFPPPDAESFFCTQKTMQLFDDDGKQGSYTKAKTRLGEDTIRIALLNDALFSDIANQQANNGFPKKEQAQKALWRSVALNSRLISDKPSKGYIMPMEGKGLLKGVILLNAVDGRYSFATKTEIVTISESNEIGISIERGEENGSI